MRSRIRPGAHERSDPPIGVTDRFRVGDGPAGRSLEPRNGAEHGPHRFKSCPRIGADWCSDRHHGRCGPRHAAGAPDAATSLSSENWN